MTRHTVDLEAVRRQTFGEMFRPRPADRQQADEILNGKLTMRPHPTWDFEDDIDWKSDPFGQRNWQAQLHMLRWLEPVRRVALDGDPVAREFWLKTCKSWIQANPPLDPKLRDPDGNLVSYAWSDMVEALRAMVLTFGLPLVAEGEDLWLADSIHEHGSWLADAKHLGHSNHALHQHQALFVVGSVFGNGDWTELAVERLASLFEQNYDDQGVNVEGAIGYHKNNLLWWEQAFKRLDAEGIQRPESAARLELAYLELAHATKPDGTFELIGDTEATTPGALSSPELDYVKSEGATGQPPAELTKIYNQGYVFGRSGWGDHERAFDKETFYSLSFGKADRVHGHQDGASLTLHSNGQPWLVDAGKYAYKKDAMREFCLSRLGHNVVDIEGKAYNPKSKVVLTRSSTSDEIDDFTFTDSGYEGVTLKRRVIYCRGGDFFVVVDNVFSTEDVTARQRWHLDAETGLEEIPGGIRLEREGKQSFILWKGNLPAISTTKGSEEPFDGWMARKWMEKTPGTVVSATQSGQRFRFITILAAPQSGSFSVKKLDATGGRMALSAMSGRYQFNLAVEEERVSVTLGEVGSNSSELEDIRSAWLKTMELCRGAEVQWSAPKPANGTFSTRYWGSLKSWVTHQPDVRKARLEALSILLDLVLDAIDGSGDDQGLRTGIVDLLSNDLTEVIGLNNSALGVMREPLVAWGGLDLRSKTYGRQIQTIRTPEEIGFGHGETSKIYSANLGGLVLPFAVGRGDSDLLSVRFHGAINRTKTTLPFFQGLTSELMEGGNHAVFQDPALDLNKNMTLSWYLGDGSTNVHRFMAECIRKLQNETGAKRILLSGSSGGGFTALQVAAYLPDSVALVFNPQTDVKEYFRTSADVALSTCLKSDASTEEARSFRLSTSVVETYAMLNDLPRVLYVQNLGDTHHVTKHRDPFRLMLESEHTGHKDRIEFVDVEWGAGHVAATAELYAQFRTAALDRFKASASSCSS
ncbi:heparinase II/III family protein [Paenarthrobacter sp. NPDC089989]|uniref:heparinase II/III family protein n=1 Tax=unclassified Paenarthrobacter TaxID=2634190 RepID=UPI0037FA3AA4